MSKKFSSLCYSTKTTFIDIIKSIKWQIILSAVIILIGFIIGMYFAFAHVSLDFTDGDKLMCFLTGNMSNFSSLIYRVLSSLVVITLLLLFSKSKWLTPLALILIFYRAYLLGINIGIMLKFYGVSGIVVAILILFPMQLIQLLFFSMFYFALLSSQCSFMIKSVKKFVLISMGVVLILNIVISLLLLLFSPQVILVL